jgi:Na+-transporting methylmalonyl-CoA/oxaloacetate decarboxylase gamma subunit
MGAEMIMIDREAVLRNILFLLILYILIQGFGDLVKDFHNNYKSSPCSTQNIGYDLCSK